MNLKIKLNQILARIKNKLIINFLIYTARYKIITFTLTHKKFSLLICCLLFLPVLIKISTNSKWESVQQNVEDSIVRSIDSTSTLIINSKIISPNSLYGKIPHADTLSTYFNQLYKIFGHYHKNPSSCIVMGKGGKYLGSKLLSYNLSTKQLMVEAKEYWEIYLDDCSTEKCVRISADARKKQIYKLQLHDNGEITIISHLKNLDSTVINEGKSPPKNFLLASLNLRSQ